MENVEITIKLDQEDKELLRELIDKSKRNRRTKKEMEAARKAEEKSSETPPADDNNDDEDDFDVSSPAEDTTAEDDDDEFGLDESEEESEPEIELTTNVILEVLKKYATTEGKDAAKAIVQEHGGGVTKIKDIEPKYFKAIVNATGLDPKDVMPKK